MQYSVCILTICPLSPGGPGGPIAPRRPLVKRREFTIFTETIMHLVYPQILQNHYLRFLLGRLYYSREIGNNGYAIFLRGWGTGRKQGALWSM